MDRFASHLNNKCVRYNSRWWVRDTEVVNAFSQNWGPDKNWAVPPPSLVSTCIEKKTYPGKKLFIHGYSVMKKTVRFWPTLVSSNGRFNACIKHIVNLSRSNVVSPGRGNNGNIC